ncbi:hypothetical protein THIOM_004509, partial [Candidatus Thiomargarita nelsonii]
MIWGSILGGYNKDYIIEGISQNTQGLQNQTWQVKNKTCQFEVKYRPGYAFDLPGLVLTWQV